MKKVLIASLTFLLLAAPQALAQTLPASTQNFINGRCSGEGRLPQPNSDCLASMTRCEQNFASGPSDDQAINTLIECRHSSLESVDRLLAPPPQISTVGTRTGRIRDGEELVIQGSGFGSTRGIATLGTLPAEMTAWSDQQIRVTYRLQGDFAPSNLTIITSLGRTVSTSFIPEARAVGQILVRVSLTCGVDRSPLSAPYPTIRLKDNSTGQEVQTVIPTSAGSFISYASSSIGSGSEFTLLVDPIGDSLPRPSSQTITFNQSLVERLANGSDPDYVEFHYPTCPAESIAPQSTPTPRPRSTPQLTPGPLEEEPTPLPEETPQPQPTAEEIPTVDRQGSVSVVDILVNGRSYFDNPFYRGSTSGPIIITIIFSDDNQQSMTINFRRPLQPTPEPIEESTPEPEPTPQPDQTPEPDETPLPAVQPTSCDPNAGDGESGWTRLGCDPDNPGFSTWTCDYNDSQNGDYPDDTCE